MHRVVVETPWEVETCTHKEVVETVKAVAGTCTHKAEGVTVKVAEETCKHKAVAGKHKCRVDQPRQRPHCCRPRERRRLQPR